jgi:hypothetical protein
VLLNPFFVGGGVVVIYHGKSEKLNSKADARKTVIN